MSSCDGMTPWRRRKPKPSSTISRMPVATPGWPFWSARDWLGASGTTSSSFSTRSEVLELLVPLHPVLARQLAQLVDVLGLQVRQVQAAVVRIGREGTGVDRGIAARRVVVASLEGGARLLAARAAAVLPSARAAAARGS